MGYGANPLKHPVGFRKPAGCCTRNNRFNPTPKNDRLQLLNKGAKVNKLNSKKYSPLMAACDNGAFEAAEILLKNGADANLEDDDGFTPLLAAIMSKNIELVGLILKHNPDKEIAAKVDYSPVAAGDTPLSLPKKLNLNDIVKLLS